MECQRASCSAWQEELDGCGVLGQVTPLTTEAGKVFSKEEQPPGSVHASQHENIHQKEFPQTLAEQEMASQVCGWTSLVLIRSSCG